MVVWIASLALLLAFHYSTHPCSQGAQISWLSLPPGWSFSANLSFPSPPASSASLNSFSEAAPFSLFVPIINSTSFDAGSKGFVLGFLSLFESPASSPTRIYFSICLGVSKNGPSSNPFLVPVWTLNTTSPFKQLTQGLVRLEVNDNKELLLKDGDGSTVWRVSGVESMQMQDMGNLAIYGAANRTVWQSFDYPRDVLLQGQRLWLGMELTSSNHMYKAVMKAGGVLLYLDSANPVCLAYSMYVANRTVEDYKEGLPIVFSLNKKAPVNVSASLAMLSCNRTEAYAVLDGPSLVVHDACGDINSYHFNTSDMVRLDADGNLRDYNVHQPYGSGYAITSFREEFSPCYTPNVCGAYGICSMSTFSGSLNTLHTCRCPSEEDNESLSNAFNFIDASKPSQGCQRTVELECEQASAQSLVEIKNVGFISLLVFYEVLWRENTIPLEDCKAACLSNCSCSGFFYHTQTSFCVPFGDKTAMSNLSFLGLAFNEHIAYVKIQVKPEESSPSLTTEFSPALVVTAVLLALIVAAFVVTVMYRKCRQQRVDPELKLAEKELLGALPTLPTRFSYQELSKFTNGFSKQLGTGGFGSVYEGVLPDGRRVAVKKLELLSHGQTGFLAEIATVGGISHVNIVSLYGFCLEKRNRLLVYEYMENGSLDKWLFWKEGKQELCVMTWEARFNVALATARGLAYLHEECIKPILHFDVKPQNILLDKELNAKLSDFGLSKLVTREQSSVMTAFRGTPGYIAPEWVLHSIVSTKCDVYSFGIVLLELVSGRKNVETVSMGLGEKCSLPKWAAAKSREGKVGEVLDKRLVKSMEHDGMDAVIEGDIMEQVKRVVGVALLCIHEEPKMRPSMKAVCSMLEGSMALPKEALSPQLRPVWWEDTEVPTFKFTSSSSVQVISHYSSFEGR